MNETIVNARADEFEISESRRKFLNKTYYHLLAAIMLFVAFISIQIRPVTTNC